MKKVSAFLVCIIVLLSGMAFAQEAVIGQITAVATDETADVEFRVTNNFSSATPIAPYVAIYNSQNQLLDIKIADTKTIGAGLSDTFSVECSVPKDKTGIHGKVFVWGDDYAPCADIKEFEITIANKYAYVLGAMVLDDGWEPVGVKLRILDKSGEICETDLAEDVELINVSAEAETSYEALASALNNQLIIYEANSAGEISKVYFATSNDANGAPCLVAYSKTENSYSSSAKTITAGGRTYKINDNTFVFFIKGSTALSGLGDTRYASTTSKVKTGGGLGELEATTPVAVYDVDDENVAAVIVVYNIDYKQDTEITNQDGFDVITGKDDAPYTPNY